MIDSTAYVTAFNFRFGGRLRRSGYFSGWGAAVALASLGFGLPGVLAQAVAMACFCVGKFLLATIVVKRLHDLGASGWWAVLLVAPLTLTGAFIGFTSMLNPALAGEFVQRIGVDTLTGSALLCHLATVVLGLFPGQRGDNRYGPDPKGLVGRMLPGLHPPI